MALKFGTSGVRGLVTDMTDRACFLYALAYARMLNARRILPTVAIAGDFRSSTPRIKQAVQVALEFEGIHVRDCGFVPTPAVTRYAMRHDWGSIMVTGSHIPDDRNGIKFNLPSGEITKADEADITKRYQTALSENVGASLFNENGMLKHKPEVAETFDSGAANSYEERYLKGFPKNCLQGRKIVVYQHSAVIRNMLVRILEGLGATAIPVGWSDAFVPVDTEAVQEPEKLAAWVKEHQADALISADGDSDRPLIVDEQGKVIRGDVLGILVSQIIGADWVCTPVSCNTALEKCGSFANIRRTRIGSPYVIAAMKEGQDEGASCVVGYEANGGFLLASTIRIPGAEAAMGQVPTRDAMLPVLAVLLESATSGQSLSALRDRLPPRFTWSGLMREFPSEKGKELVALIGRDPEAFAAAHMRDTFGNLKAANTTDGVRLTFSNDVIVHFRPSGNAPEFRCYTEADTEEAAIEANENAMKLIETTLKPLVM